MSTYLYKTTNYTPLVAHSTEMTAMIKMANGKAAWIKNDCGAYYISLLTWVGKTQFSSTAWQLIKPELWRSLRTFYYATASSINPYQLSYVPDLPVMSPLDANRILIGITVDGITYFFIASVDATGYWTFGRSTKFDHGTAGISYSFIFSGGNWNISVTKGHLQPQSGRSNFNTSNGFSYGNPLYYVWKAAEGAALLICPEVNAGSTSDPNFGVAIRSLATTYFKAFWITANGIDPPTISLIRTGDPIAWGTTTGTILYRDTTFIPGLEAVNSTFNYEFFLDNPEQDGTQGFWAVGMEPGLDYTTGNSSTYRPRVFSKVILTNRGISVQTPVTVPTENNPSNFHPVKDIKSNTNKRMPILIGGTSLNGSAWSIDPLTLATTPINQTPITINFTSHYPNFIGGNVQFFSGLQTFFAPISIGDLISDIVSNTQSKIVQEWWSGQNIPGHTPPDKISTTYAGVINYGMLGSAPGSIAINWHWASWSQVSGHVSFSDVGARIASLIPPPGGLAPPLRQRQRGDTVTGGPNGPRLKSTGINPPASRQMSNRQGNRNTFT